MKVISQPSSGALGTIVAYLSPFGQIYRTRVRPRNSWSASRDFMRGAFGHHSQVYSRGLTQAQRDRWCYAGGQVMSHPRLGQQGWLSGQQFHERINCVLSRVGRPSVAEPPAPVMFGPSPVGELVVTEDEDGVRLFVRVSEEWARGDARLPGEDVMVFGQAPCSAGRSKRRNVSYLGLLLPAVDGLSEITQLYKARHGEPRPGTKVFIVTRQQKDGWEGPRHEASEIVPGSPAKHAKEAKAEAVELRESNGLKGLNGVGAAGGTPKEGSAATTGGNSQKVHMHKGSTRGAQRSSPPAVGGLSGAVEGGTSGGKAAGAGIGGGGEDGGGGGSPG